MVGIRSFPFGSRPIFRGKLTVSFSEGTSQKIYIWANFNDLSRRVVTLNGGLVREYPQNPRNIQVYELFDHLPRCKHRTTPKDGDVGHTVDGRNPANQLRFPKIYIPKFIPND